MRPFQKQAPTNNDAVSNMGFSVGGVTRLNDDNKSIVDVGGKTKGKKIDPFLAIQFDESESATPKGP